MSSPEKKAGGKVAETAGEHGLSASDVAFLMTCLKNTTGGSVSVDAQAVATALNMTNPKSVSNKLRGFKTKHNIPLTTSTKKATDTTSGSEPVVPTTPSSRVTKNKTPRKAVKSTAKVNSEDEVIKDQAETESEVFPKNEVVTNNESDADDA